MKITVLLLTVLCLHVSARSWSQKVTLSVKNMPLQKVFSLIEKQTGYAFFYDLDLLNGHTASLDVKDAEITAVLKECLRDLPLDFKVVNTTIAIIKRQPPKIVAELAPAPRSETEVKGQVKSEAGLPMSGATVTLISGKTRKSIATDAQGEFMVPDLPKGKYTMEITFIGYETFRREVVIGDQAVEVSAILKAAISGLDETVVKGYYNTTKRLNTGNVTTVKGEDIQKQPVSDPILALEGRVPGLYISQASGMPGANLVVRLRGQNSIANGNDPLYVVDGVTFTSNSLTVPTISGGALGNPVNGIGLGISPFNNLNPADIESIDVLKDADATAIYGSRGANGVILITTKKGKEGQTRFDINVYHGIGEITRKLPLMNTQQYLTMRRQAYKNDGISTIPANAYDLNGKWDTTRYTDWQKVLIGNTAQFTNAQASLSGGNANTQFMLNGGYSYQTTVFPGDYSDKKASLHINLNHISQNRKFHALFTAQYLEDNNVLPQIDFTSNINLAPDAPSLYDVNGNINWQNNTWTNPIAFTLRSSKAVTDNLGANLNISYDILPGLQLKSSMGYAQIQLTQTNLIPAKSFAPPTSANPLVRQNSFGTNNINTLIIEPQINYGIFIGKGRLDALVGSTFQQNIQNSVGQKASGFSNDQLISNIAAASTIIIMGNASTKYHYAAIFSRLNYNWEGKYIVNLTARRDGSSRFGPGRQFGNFGAIGAGWIFSKEKFIQNNLAFFSFGKLRASYGTTGNDQINDYQFLSTYEPYTNSTYQTITGLYPTKLANPNFGWEVVKKMELGLELGFLKDRVLFNLNYYRNRTGNQLVGQPIPSIAGFTIVQANLPATVQNTGVEIELNTLNIKKHYFTWSSSINLSIPRNRLISFPGLASNPNYQGTYEIGKSLFAKPLYEYTGIDLQKGIYTFADINKDGVIDFQDNQFRKQVSQNYYGAINNSFGYKKWQLAFLLQFVNQTAYNSSYFFNLPGIFNKNQPLEIINSWKKPNDKSSIQIYSSSTGKPAGIAFTNFRSSDGIISSGSFIRLKNIFLSYSLPVGLIHQAKFENLKLYLQCQNLFTKTEYRGLDPETQGLSLPPLRMITGGIQIIF